MVSNTAQKAAPTIAQELCSTSHLAIALYPFVVILAALMNALRRGRCNGVCPVALLVLLSVLTTPAQVIDSMDPPYGSPGERVMIYGGGFAPGTLTVKFGGADGVRDTTAQATSASVIYARVPSGAKSGPVYVQVGTKSTLSLQDFQVVGLGPLITGFLPVAGPVNQNVTIFGWHLTNLVSVKFGGKNSTSFVANANGSQINARVPAGATNGPITVTTTYGTSNSVSSFTVIGEGPYITGFSPLRGTPGTTVSIEGVQFSQVTNVTFGGIKAANIFVQSDIQIYADAPPTVVSSRIAVHGLKGSHTNETYFHVPPAITSFSPSSGRAGTNITIRGTNFLDTMSVTIGGVPATIVAATNNTVLVVTAPEGAASGPVRVNAPAGAEITSSNFNYQPLITGFNPVAGPVGTTVSVTGRNLNEGFVSFTVGGAASTTNAPASAGNVSVRVGSAALTGPLSVTTTNGTFTTTNLFYLPPSLTGFTSTNSPPGTPMTLRGLNLLGTTNVTFGGVPASFTPATVNTQIIATVPAGVMTGPIAVTTPAGTASFGRFYGKPAIDSFSPANGLPGTSVVIQGTNFLDATEVAFNGVPTPGLTVVSNGGAILVQVPQGAFTGPVSVKGPAGTTTSAAHFVVDLASDLVLGITAVPNPVFVSSNLVYTMMVTNLGPSDCPAVTLENHLPAELKLVSHIISQGSVSVQSNRVVAQFGAIQKTKTANLRLTVEPQSVVGLVGNSASVEGSLQDPDPANNSASTGVQVLPLPRLEMAPYSAGQWMISWPLMLSNYALQYRGTFTANNWSNLATTPIVAGTNRFVVEPTANGVRFYRLRSTP